jgi:hypothetical protein
MIDSLKTIMAAATILTITATTSLGESDRNAPVRKSVPDNKSKTLPTLVLALGDDIKDVVARSTVIIATQGMLDTQLFDSNTPKTFIYSDPELGFTLPEAAFFNMSTSLGHVTRVQIGPHVGVLNIDQALERLPRLIALFDKVGWQRDPTYKNTEIRQPDHLSSLRASFQKAQTIPSRALVESWKNGDTKLHIDLVLTRKGGASPTGTTEDHYLIVIEIANRKLMREWDEKVMEWWRKDGVSGPRPLDTVGKKKSADR